MFFLFFLWACLFFCLFQSIFSIFIDRLSATQTAKKNTETNSRPQHNLNSGQPTGRSSYLISGGSAKECLIFQYDFSINFYSFNLIICTAHGHFLLGRSGDARLNGQFSRVLSRVESPIIVRTCVFISNTNSSLILSLSLAPNLRFLQWCIECGPRNEYQIIHLNDQK